MPRHQMSIYLTTSQCREVEKRARASGVSRSEFIVTAIMNFVEPKSEPTSRDGQLTEILLSINRLEQLIVAAAPHNRIHVKAERPASAGTQELLL